MKKYFLTTLLIAIFFSNISLIGQDMRDVKIGIVYSEKTKQLIYLQDKSFNPIQDWEIFFLNRKISYTVISDEDLNNNEFDFLDVLILPSVEVLSENAAANLFRFLESGKGLLFFGKFDVYDSNGNKKYLHPFQDKTGLGFSELNTEDNITVGFKLSSSAIGRNLYGKDEVLVLNRFNPLVAKSSEKNCKTVGKYFFPDNKRGAEVNPAVIILEKNNGRIIWFGMQLSQILGEQQQEVTVEKFIFNSIKWLSPFPVLALNNWPEGNGVPVIISSIVNNLKFINENKYEPNYFAEDHINLFIDFKNIESIEDRIGNLVAAGDIDLLLNPYFTENQINDSLLLKHYDILKANSRQKFFGIKMSSYQYDVLKEKIINSPFDFVLFDDNLFYLFKKSNSDKNKSVQRIIPTVTISISGKGDRQTLTEIEKAFEYARDNGEVVCLNLSDRELNYNLNDKENFSIVTEYLKKQNVWFATYSEIIDWISKQDNVTAKIDKTEDDNTYKISIENRNQTDIKNFSLQLFPSALEFNPQISTSRLQLKYDPELKTYVIIVPYLRAGMKEVFNLVFDEIR